MFAEDAASIWSPVTTLKGKDFALDGLERWMIDCDKIEIYGFSRSMSACASMSRVCSLSYWMASCFDRRSDDTKNVSSILEFVIDDVS